MEIILSILGISVAYFIFSYFLGNPSFWRLATKYPDEVFALMLENSDVWILDVGDGDEWDDKNKADYAGPFTLFVSNFDIPVKVYGKADQIEQDQKRIRDLIEQVKLN